MIHQNLDYFIWKWRPLPYFCMNILGPIFLFSLYSSRKIYLLPNIFFVYISLIGLGLFVCLCLMAYQPLYQIHFYTNKQFYFKQLTLAYVHSLIVKNISISCY